MVALRYRRHPTPANLNVAAFFGLAALFIGHYWAVIVLELRPESLFNRLFPMLVLAMPVLLLRLADGFTHVPRSAFFASGLGLVLSSVALAASVPVSLPALAIIVFYFVGTSAYASQLFWLSRRDSIGANKRRLSAIVLGTCCLAGALLVGTIRSFTHTPSQWMPVLSQLLALGTAISYFVGFTPPRFLRRAWQQPELLAFLADSPSMLAAETDVLMLRSLEARASAVLGGGGCSVGLFDAGRNTLSFLAPDNSRFDIPVDQTTVAGRVLLEQRPVAWNEVATDHPFVASFYKKHAIKAMLFAPMTVGERPLGVLACYAVGHLIFSEEDLDLLDHVAKQAAMLLEGRSLLAKRAEALAAEQASQAQARLAAIIESSHDAVISKTLEGTILSWNSAAEQLYGYTADEAVGRSITMLNPPDRSDEEPAILEQIRHGERVKEFETVRLRKDGTPVEVSVTVSPVLDGSGRVIGASNIGRDISVRKQAEKALEESRQRLELAMDAGKMGSWEWDLQTNAIAASPALEIIHGFEPGSFSGSPRVFRDQIHPDDLPRVLASVQQTVASGSDMHMEYRIVLTDGSMRWLESRGRLRMDEKNRKRLVGVTWDITARKTAEMALRDGDRRKEEFLAILSHELRNPLAPIRNAAEVLIRKGSQDAESRLSHEIIARQVTHMARLLDDLLDVSRINRGKLELRPRPVEVKALMEAAIETSRPFIERADHQLTVRFPPEAVYVNGDPFRLAQVLSNLINNAAKYTPDHGRIELSARVEASWIALSVSDNGIGMSAHTLAKAFEMFAQAAPALERAQGGLGVGLSLVKSLVEMHGGSVEARSDGIDRGSRFTVRLPIMMQAITGAGTGAEPISASTEKSRHRILVVDDSRDSADSMAALLRLGGHEVSTAYSGKDAIESAQQLRPDLLLLDLGLPDLSGYAVCRTVRAALGSNVSIVAMTGWGQEEDRQRTANAGFDHHLVKPVNAPDIERVLREWEDKRSHGAGQGGTVRR
jgi:PAS domain S-box-containing protein